MTGTDAVKVDAIAPVIIQMDWDGKTITGSINPGLDAIPFTKAELDPGNWTVHLEADGKGTLYAIDGKLFYAVAAVSGAARGAAPFGD